MHRQILMLPFCNRRLEVGSTQFQAQQEISYPFANAYNRL